MRFSWGTIAFLVVQLVGGATARAQPQDANFTQTTYASGLGNITDLAWAGDGTNQYLFFTQQTGALRVVRNGTLQTASVATVSPVLSGGELGLLGVAVDPAFSSNRRVFVFASVNSSVQRIFRYTTTETAGAVGVSAGPTQIGPDLPCRGVNHDGGGIAFGPDGNLYFGVGNLGNGNNVGGDGTANELDSLGSKIGRMTPAGNPLASNPHYTNDGNDTARDYIWSRGFRNPYGITFQPGTSDPWVLEVGDAFEHIFIVPSGSNRGWPTEGNTSATNGKLIPRLAYQRDSGPNWAAGGGCITRGCFYTGTTFPAQYQGNLFFVDHNGAGKLVRAVPNGTGTIPSGNVSLFVNNVSGIVDVEVGPDGALYYASRGNSAVYRLQYTMGTPQNIIVSASTLQVTEAASGTFTVRLAAAPAANVVVQVAETSGNADVSALPAALTFTAGNWNTPRTVTVSAAADADSINDGATITASATGLTPQNVAITVIDTTIASGAPTALITQPLNGAVVSGSNAELYGDGTDPQGVSTLVRAEFRIDGNLVYTDSSPGGHYHLGGDHGMWDTTTLSSGSHVLRMTVYDNGGLSGSHEIVVTKRPAPDAAVDSVVPVDAPATIDGVARDGTFGRDSGAPQDGAGDGLRDAGGSGGSAGSGGFGGSAGAGGTGGEVSGPSDAAARRDVGGTGGLGDAGSASTKSNGCGCRVGQRSPSAGGVPLVLLALFSRGLWRRRRST